MYSRSDDEKRGRANLGRRGLLTGTASSAAALPLAAAAPKTTPEAQQRPEEPGAAANVRLTINGRPNVLMLDPRTTLLDTLREHVGLTGSKRGCDHGQCGACTVHIGGRRVLSCLTLAASANGKDVTTVEGLEKDGELHPVQEAFVSRDGFQCGFCTSGQIMSAVAFLREGRARTDDEIREAMSGNICRCGAYGNIVDAVKQAGSCGRAI